jgi:hypothetical protein
MNNSFLNNVSFIIEFKLKLILFEKKFINKENE